MSNKAHKSSIRGKVFIFLFIIYMAALVYLYFGKSFPSSLPKELWGYKIDKVAHFLMFLPFPFLAHGSFSGKRKWRNLLFIFFLGIVIAYAFELFQHDIAPYRTTDPWDLVVNIASLTIATFILAIIDIFRK